MNNNEMVAINIYAESKRVAAEVLTLALLLDAESIRVVTAREGGYRIRVVLRHSDLQAAISGTAGDMIADATKMIMERVK